MPEPGAEAEESQKLIKSLHLSTLTAQERRGDMGLNTSQREAERHPGIWHVLIVHLPYVVLRWAKHCLCPQEIQSCAVRTAQITSHES